ncbi:hypothetical protein GCM10023194_35790 [Planotetraspora phitsanulokensis]|uniref:Uncharacterized protein n=1 Tax=Planotetraspora phitsanulokensis TaxID=575192 RepID=A0A8J3U0C0_9ACTN|nr:DUF6069 family protein [Planotetraspora phitsanulokensis]GII36293.1 hypothetical protein Pph01_12960 [Planotetraspora phitsanulokensis]
MSARPDLTSVSTAPAADRPTRGRRLVVVAGASVAALAIWALAGPVAGIDLTVRLNGADQQVGAGAVIAASLAAGLAAWASLALLERLTDRARRIWTIIAVVVLVFSLTGPLGAAGAAGMAVLACMHLTVAAVLIPGLTVRRRG